MLHSAPPATIRERLLSEAVRERELSARAVPVIEDLLQHGLSFEQALVGTGLISSETFASWMQAATQLPLLKPSLDERALPPGLDVETILAWRVVPRKTGANQWTIGLAHPWDADVRTALEALAVEHGWVLTLAYVLPSEADLWLRSLDRSSSAHRALRQYARSLVERVEREERLTIHQAGAALHPREHAVSVPAAWLPALELRLARRARSGRLHTRHHRHYRHGKLELHAPRASEPVPLEAEHPVREWTDTFQAFLDQGKIVFVLDERGDLLDPWSELHVAHETEEWRGGKRWLTPAKEANQEELFHLTLSGYPGTVCFSSMQDLQAWERAAEKAQVDYASCIGRPTRHGIAWSLYSV